MSVLPSVLSEGSPGSPFGIFSCIEDRSLFAAGGLSVEATFLCLVVLSGAVDSPSSPDASLDEACKLSITIEFFVKVLVLFRLAEPADDGEDILPKVSREPGEMIF